MEKLNDYGGDFIPDLKIEDFAPEVLARMVRMYTKIYQAMDGFWYLTIMDKISNQAALDCDIGAWEKTAPYEMKRISELLNIHGNDVTTLMKAIQFTPWFISSDYETELISRNHAIITVTRCTTLLALEREGKGREKEICTVFEPMVFKLYAGFFNPDIKIKCLKAPPRKRHDGICCRWEFKLGDA